MNRYILFGAGKECENAIRIIGRDNIQCICDNDESKVGTALLNVPIVSYSKERFNNSLVYVSARGEFYHQIKNQLDGDRIKNRNVRELYLKYGESNPFISGWKNKYMGKRCFIIGTGPSLTVEDLEKLSQKGEISFGANRIFKMYHQTTWRPDFYFVQDYKLIAAYMDDLMQLDAETMFISDVRKTRYSEQIDKEAFGRKFKGIFNIYYNEEMVSSNELEFSEEPDKYIVEGMTVIYGILQLAYFMGFSEMYLIGVDFNYSDMSGLDKGVQDHCCKNYIKKGEIVNPPRLDINLKAFRSAEKFARLRNFKIFNATRGGKLEVFERIDFDELLK